MRRRRGAEDALGRPARWPRARLQRPRRVDPGGKTLLWQLPALQGGGLTVVVVPSVALALDLKESTDKILAGTGLFC